MGESRSVLTNPQNVYVDLSDKLFRIKAELLEEMSLKALEYQKIKQYYLTPRLHIITICSN